MNSQKVLSLALSVAMLNAYAMPISAAERIVVANGETYSVTNEEIVGLNNPDQWGGAIFNSDGTLKVENSAFNNNIGYSGGAITASTKSTNETSIVNSHFENNHAVYDGGAIGNFSAMTISGSKFIGNTAQLTADSNGEYTVVSDDTTSVGGGAISFGAVSSSKVASISDTLFQNNASGHDGGAIATRNAKHANNSAATLDISATFDGNKAYDNGGAIYNSFYANNGLGKGDGVTVTGKFTNNQAGISGGAIYNDGTADKGGNPGGVMTIANAEFTGNNAASRGGAIYNSGTLSVDNATFKANTAFEGGAIFSAGKNDYKTNADLAVTTISNSSFTNNTLTAADAGGAVVAGRNSKVVISNSIFDSNKVEGSKGWGGAINSYASADDSRGHSKGGMLDISDSVFTNNEAAAVGAVGIFSEANLKNLHFENNKATDAADDGGGAVFLGSVSKTAMENVTFANNTSAATGGAISMRANNLGNHQAATLDIKSASFENNTAGTNGGAIFNTFFNDAAGTGSASIASSSFTSNSAANGGAIYNDGSGDKGGNIAAMTLKDTSFTNNTASGKGGAIYNHADGIINFTGTNTFSGNTAAGTVNDVYNEGTLNINNGTTTLEGGVTGTGSVNVNGGTLNIGESVLQAGAVKFAAGTTLGVTLGNNTMGAIDAGSIAVGEDAAAQANLQVTLSKDFLDTAEMSKQLTATAVQNGKFALADVTNALYNVSFNDASNTVTAVRKSQEEQNQEITNAGGNANNAAVINAFTSAADAGSAPANQTAEIINTLAQTDVKAAVEATTALAPEEASTKQVVHTSANRQLFSAISSHIDNAMNAAPRTFALGNEEASYSDGQNYSVWAQGLINKSHKEETSGASAFTGRSTGLAGGADMKVNDEWLVGAGYGYLHTNVSSFNRHDRILGDNFFVYGQYRPSQLFVQAALNYGDSKYEENKYLPGMTVNADYHIKSYAANVTAGYEINDWLTPLLGVRYLNLQQEGYTDSSDQSVSASQDDYLSAMLGAKVQTEYRLGAVRLKPQANAGIVYDFISDNTQSNVVLPNGTSYNIDGERLHRLSFEAGASVSVLVRDNVEVLLGYTGNFRNSYNSNTGMLKLRYMF